MNLKKGYFFVFLVTFFIVIPIFVFGLTAEEEKKYGSQIYNEITRSTTINSDPYISMHVRQIKERLESIVNMPFNVVVTIIDSPTMDAFATIGGYVYITTGLIAQCEKEEELAGVIAHEFAHIYRRHIAKRYEKEKYINIGMLSSIALAMLAPNPKAKEAILTTGIASAQSMALKYSREDEDEADSFGSKFADSAGYGGFGIAEFLKKLRLSGTDKTLPQYLLTHPYHEERIIKLEGLWKDRKTIHDSPLFPFIIIRAKFANTIGGDQSDDIWISRFQKDRDNPVLAYGAYLVYLRKGKIKEALTAASSIISPVRDLLYGEALTAAGKFKEAIEILKSIKQDSDWYP
ncbi:MAG TPA: M48 family metalloprotease, partial [Syntrophorhabdaceae bacterium]|nr:M48 family metalloprotease [Syntrophorhabdaceae bacterium]